MSGDVRIRPLEGIEEFRAAQTVMGETWGYHQNDMAALPTLIATAHAGGFMAGAFDGERLVGISWAFPGIMEGKLLLYSQMTAVLPDARGRGIGFKIKQYQRNWALEHGFEHVRWTFDPLMAPNARFNLHHLGASAIGYLVDFYGRSDSPLHGALPTDRFLADWDLRSPRVATLAKGGEAPLLPEPHDPLPQIYELEEVGTGSVVPGPPAVPDPAKAPYALAPIPPDFLGLQCEEPDVAGRWRMGTREAFRRAFDAGYLFVDFVEPCGGTGASPGPGYLLAARSVVGQL